MRCLRCRSGIDAVVAPRYRVIEADLEKDRQRILDFWRRIDFGAPDRPERYDWFHLRNPEARGRIYLMLLEDGDEILGTACAGTRRVQVPGGRTLTASVLVDFAVDPAHRSVGPALLLQRAARERELQQADLLYGLPDTKAVPIFKRLGSDQQLVEASYAYVVRSGPYLRRKLPAWAAPIATLGGELVDLGRGILLRARALRSGLSCEWHAQMPDALDGLWSSSLEGLRFGIGVRNRQYLAWRFELGDWRLGLVSARRDGRPVAYMACRRIDDELHVADLLLAGDAGAQRKAVEAFLVLARRERVKVIRLDLLAPDETVAALQAAGFVVRGGRPCFIVRNRERFPEAFGESWWFTKADEDV